MLSQNQVKHITALGIKKYREEYRQFIAEGHKLVTELINSDFTVAGIYASAEWLVANLPMIRQKNIPVFETLPREMERISALATASPVLAVVDIPGITPAPPGVNPATGLILALDDIRDPGNLGTIIRIADWFGIGTVLCSESCVDQYNPKVVQATMGSIARVRVTRCSLPETLSTLDGYPVYGAFLEGESIYDQPLTGQGVIVIGNESRGISQELEPFISRKISIPSYGNSLSGKAESLNASVATAIICAEFRRKGINN